MTTDPCPDCGAFHPGYAKCPFREAPDQIADYITTSGERGDNPMVDALNRRVPVKCDKVIFSDEAGKIVMRVDVWLQRRRSKLAGPVATFVVDGVFELEREIAGEHDAEVLEQAHEFALAYGMNEVHGGS